MTRAICIVDDDEAVLHSLQMLFEQQGIRVSCYSSADAFLRRTTLDGYGCFLFDQKLPELKGVELLEVLRARGLNTPAIIITAGSDPLLEARARRAGALTVLYKPIPVGELTALVEQAFDGAYRPGNTKPGACQPHT